MGTNLDFEKLIWDENDFEKMGWHDSTIYATAFKGENFEFALDIDYPLRCKRLACTFSKRKRAWSVAGLFLCLGKRVSSIFPG
jgi:hypothetical protein